MKHINDGFDILRPPLIAGLIFAMPAGFRRRLDYLVNSKALREPFIWVYHNVFRIRPSRFEPALKIPAIAKSKIIFVSCMAIISACFCAGSLAQSGALNIKILHHTDESDECVAIMQTGISTIPVAIQQDISAAGISVVLTPTITYDEPERSGQPFFRNGGITPECHAARYHQSGFIKDELRCRLPITLSLLIPVCTMSSNQPATMAKRIVEWWLVAFKCPDCCDEDLVRKAGGSYSCTHCSRTFDQFELCFGTKPPSRLPHKPPKFKKLEPPFSEPSDDYLQPSRIPKKPLSPDGSLSVKLKEPIAQTQSDSS